MEKNSIHIMETMTGAKALMTAMEKEGVKEVFGLPGGANLPMYDEFSRCNIRHILTRHEQSAAHMADGFGRVSRKPGVCFATSGPGATNILTGIATAQADSSPMVAVTGQVPVAMIGKDAFQESDIIGMANPVVKYSFQPRLPEEVPEAVKKGFYIAQTGRPGPVLLDIPKDVQQNEAPMDFPDEFKIQGYHPWNDPDIASVEKAIDMLLNSEKPIILAGGGTIISSAFAELQSVAETLMIPVVTTFKGKGAFPENHPLSLGPIGMHGHAEANKMMAEADCVLAIGTRFSDRSVGTFEAFEKRLKIIHMDVDPAEIGKNQTTNISVVGDVRASLRIMVKLLLQKSKGLPKERFALRVAKHTALVRQMRGQSFFLPKNRPVKGVPVVSIPTNLPPSIREHSGGPKIGETETVTLLIYSLHTPLMQESH